MLLRCKIVLAACIALLFFSQNLKAASPTFTFVTTHFPPYDIEHNAGEHSGHDVEVVREVFSRAGYSINVEFYPWKRAFNLVKNGRVSALISCAKTKEREQHFLYSEPISTGTRTYVALNSYKGRVPTTLKDGKGLNVIAVDGYKNSLELDEAEVEHYAAPNDDTALRLLFNRDFDFFYSSREIIQYKALKQNKSNRIKFFDIKHINFHLCFSRIHPDSKQLLSIFNKGLADIKTDGTFSQIHNRYK